MRKECSECGQAKLAIDFYSKPRKSEYPDSKAGLSHRCKECDKAARKAYVESNKDKTKLSDRKYHLSKYGLTIESYNAMFVAQEGKCLGCGKHQTELSRQLVVDHCHKTSKVRGLLCWQCNSALGCIQDNTETLTNLIKYLDNSRSVDNQTDTSVVIPMRK